MSIFWDRLRSLQSASNKNLTRTNRIYTSTVMTQLPTETKHANAWCHDVMPPSVKKNVRAPPMKNYKYAHDSVRSGAREGENAACSNRRCCNTLWQAKRRM